MNNKAALWGLNFLVAVGLIAILLLGFYALISSLGPGDVNKVKAIVSEIGTDSQLINFFRIPVRGKIIADLPGELGAGEMTCADLSVALRSFYGPNVNYVFSVNDKKKCSQGSLKKKPLKIGLPLPTYEGFAKNITLEVSP